jgi:hypothetical protein
MIATYNLENCDYPALALSEFSPQLTKASKNSLHEIQFENYRADFLEGSSKNGVLRVLSIFISLVKANSYVNVTVCK